MSYLIIRLNMLRESSWRGVLFAGGLISDTIESVCHFTAAQFALAHGRVDELGFLYTCVHRSAEDAYFGSHQYKVLHQNITGKLRAETTP